MSREKQRELEEINRPRNEELFNNLEKQYQEVAKVKAENEQIEEMAKEIYEGGRNRCHHMSCFVCQYDANNDDFCKEKAIATYLYEQGYRKQEWISVDERLPEVAQKVLLFSPSDGINLGYVTDDKRFYVYKSYPDRPTHWMPLPEAPKMKGGE